MDVNAELQAKHGNEEENIVPSDRTTWKGNKKNLPVQEN